MASGIICEANLCAGFDPNVKINSFGFDILLRYSRNGLLYFRFYRIRQQFDCLQLLQLLILFWQVLNC